MSTDDRHRSARIDRDSLRAITGLAGPRPDTAADPATEAARWAAGPGSLDEADPGPRSLPAESPARGGTAAALEDRTDDRRAVLGLFRAEAPDHRAADATAPNGAPGAAAGEDDPSPGGDADPGEIATDDPDPAGDDAAAGASAIKAAPGDREEARDRTPAEPDCGGVGEAEHDVAETALVASHGEDRDGREDAPADACDSATPGIAWAEPEDPAAVEAEEIELTAEGEDSAPAAEWDIAPPDAADDPVESGDRPAQHADAAREGGGGPADRTAQHDLPAKPDVEEDTRPKPPQALDLLLAREAAQAHRPSPSDLLATAYAGLEDMARRLAGFEHQLDAHTEADGSAISLEARRVRKRIRAFEPSVAVIGQIKAGKTTLVNAMAGWPGLLPADVNPWTSVVTSLHLGAQGSTEGHRATFQFFDERTWANLVQRGGRVGELAGRAGADAELDKVRRQLDEMREKSRRRLGRRFEMLLGQTHDYEEFDEALIERYVCMGDDFWEDDGASRQKGRFADITRSADLWFPRPETPLALCLRDTPGVNDTFMIREQITINALRGSRLCVMVLSAHQALTSVDLALIRLISNIKARDVVIFVNRIDELAEPAAAVPEIEESIRATLKKFEGPEDVRIVFGSGHWAEKALTGDTAGIGADSAQALLDYAEAHPGPAGETVQSLLWRLSGIPELSAALARRIEAGAGAQFAAQIETAIGNLDRGAAMAGPMGLPGSMTPRRLHIDAAEVARELSELEQRALTALENRLAEVRGTFDLRIEKSRQSFLGRATASLLKHLEDFGEGVVWSYDPVGLRTLLRSAYQVYVRGAAKAGEETMAEAAAALDALYARAFGDSAGPGLNPPPLPQAPAPVALGQTIALDLKGSWWTRFWRRTRGYEAFAESFAKLIHEETGPIVGALQHETADPYQRQLRAALVEFMGSQRSILTDLASPAEPAGIPAPVRPLRTAATPQPDRKVQPLRPPRPQGSSRTARLQRQGE